MPRAADVSFVAALAIHDAVAATAPQLADSLRLKWPNDLLLDGAKMCGILIETAPGHAGHMDGDPLLAVGIGVNLASHPDGTPYPATNLLAHSVQAAPRDVLARLAHAFTQWLEVWDRGRNFEAVREAWLARAQGLGGPITVRLPGEVIEGDFVSLDADGALTLRTPAGGRDTLRRITAGDVFFPGTGA